MDKIDERYMPGSPASLLTALLVRRGYHHTKVMGPRTLKFVDPDYVVTIYAADGSVVRTMVGAPQSLREQIKALPQG